MGRISEKLLEAYMSDVEEEVHDVSVLDDVVLALDGELAGGAAFGFGTVLDEIVVLPDFDNLKTP